MSPIRGQFFDEKAKWEPPVQIHSAPHFSLRLFGHRGESIEKRAFARDLQSRADPESGSDGSDSPKSAIPLSGAIYLGPRIIALDSLRLSSPSIRQNLAQWCDGAFGPAYTSRIRAMEIRDHPTGPRSPWQNGHVERLIGSIRRESLDHIIVFGEAHLVAVLKDYAS